MQNNCSTCKHTEILERDLREAQRKLKKLLAVVAKLRQHADLILTQPWLVEEIESDGADTLNRTPRT